MNRIDAEQESLALKVNENNAEDSNGKQTSLYTQ